MQSLTQHFLMLPWYKVMWPTQVQDAKGKPRVIPGYNHEHNKHSPSGKKTDSVL